MRAVSLLPAATEIVAELGASESLVGISHECDYPPEVVGLPRVTRGRLGGENQPAAVDRLVRHASDAGEPLFDVDEEVLARLRPDVILTQAVCDVCAVREQDVRDLAGRLRPVPRVVTLSASGLDGVFGDIEAVAAALEVSDEADELLAGMRERLHRVHARLKAAAVPRPRVAVIEWTDPVYCAGHWVPQMVHRAGGAEVIGAPEERSRAVSVEDLAAAAPEVLVFAPCGYALQRAAQEARLLLAGPEWAWAASTRAWAMDANALVSRPGPRLVTGVEVLAQILHPTVFPAPLQSRAMAVGADSPAE